MGILKASLTNKQQFLVKFTDGRFEYEILVFKSIGESVEERFYLIYDSECQITEIREIKE